MFAVRFCCLLLCLSSPLTVAEAAPAAEDPGDRLHALFAAEWQWTLKTQPTFASYLGDKRYNHLWPDLSLKAIERRHQHRVDVLKKLNTIPYDKLSAADKVNYRLFKLDYENSVEEHRYQWYLVPLNQRSGIQTANSLADSLRFKTVKDYEDWIARLRTFPKYMDQTLVLMQKGARTKRVHAHAVMRRLPAQIRKQLVKDPTDSPFFKPFRRFPDTVKPADRKRLVAEAKRLITRELIPQYEKMLVFVERIYLPACFKRVGVSQIPDGKAFYAFRARRYTTTKLTPKQIHEIGLREVKRIRGQMQAIIKQVKFKGNFKQFLEHLRTDPKFYYKNANELLAAYRDASKKIDPQLVKLFKTLPRMPYGVEPIPMQIAPDTTTAYYRPPAADGSRAGTYFVNLYKLDSRPKYEIEALTLHESVPGHHLQIALAMELGGMPAFRRYGGYTAFVEGWALYGESLGADLGLYKDPYSKFGQLTYEMWRAVRLVVDTGMHTLGWSRKRAIDFFAANTAKSMLDIENEIDRYIAWPGQALAYKIGELKIKALRARAEKELGNAFDVRDFHEVVLGSGAVTLDVLEENVCRVDRTGQSEIAASLRTQATVTESLERDLRQPVGRKPLTTSLDTHSVLGPDGRIAARLDDYEHRPQQLQMAEAVERAIENRNHLIVEAGTGVGKSFAYLVPAILAATRNQAAGADTDRKKKPIVISTHTIALQEQLISRDIPFLNAVLPVEFTAVLAKGRSNYISLRRMKGALERSQSLFDDDHETRELRRITEWSQRTGDGSRSDLAFAPQPRVWDEVRSDHGNCLGRRCPTYEDCFYYRARRRVWNADVLVVNHALFFADLALRREGASVLPDYDAVILDEAHTLESVAGDHLGVAVSSGQIDYLLNRLYNDRTNRGLLVHHRLREAQQAITEIRLRADDFFFNLREHQRSAGTSNGRVRRPLMIDDPLGPLLRRLGGEIAGFANTLDEEEERIELTSAADRCAGMAVALETWLNQSQADSCYWVETSGRKRQATKLVCAPINVGPVLRDELFIGVDTVVLTSATLAVGQQDFTFLKTRVGLSAAEELKLGSPFNYREQVQLNVAASLPDPSDARTFRNCGVRADSALRATV